MSLQDRLNQSLAQQKQTTQGGKGTMKNLFGAFKNQFGKVEGRFAFSIATGGLAIRKGHTNEFVAFNAETGTITEVTGLTLDFNVPAFKLPVEASQVKKGQIVLNGTDYGYVTNVADGYLEVVIPEKNVRGSVLPTTNVIMGGKAFYTVVQTLDAAGEGGFNPMLLMAMGDGKKDDLLPFLLMSGGLGGAQAAGQIDPMMLMMLQDSADDLLPLMLMQQGGALGEGFNPLMFLMMSDKKGGKGGKFDDLLPLMMMQQGGAAAGGINPMMLMMMGDGGGDMKDLLMMQALGGQGFNLFGTK